MCQGQWNRDEKFGDVVKNRDIRAGVMAKVYLPFDNRGSVNLPTNKLKMGKRKIMVPSKALKSDDT